MLAERLGARGAAEAGAEAELGGGDEGGPFVVLEGGGEGVAVDEAADGVPVAVCAVWVELRNGRKSTLV